MPTAIPGGSLIDGSGDIATLNVSEEVFAENGSRQYLLIQNVSDTTMWVNFGTAAVADQPSIMLVSGAALEFGAGNTGVVPTATVNIICSASGKAYTAKES
jgi:hypothetical protein